MDMYENFVSSHPKGSFTQSSAWREVKNNWISETVTVSNENNKIIGSALILIKKIKPLNTAMLYSPRGFVCDFNDINILKKLIDQIWKLQKKYNAFMLKIDPLILANEKEAVNNLLRIGFRHSEKTNDYDTIQCRNNYILRLSEKTEQSIFDSFNSKCRYNIRLAERKGVVCKACGIEAVEDFYGLMKETGNRDGFSVRSAEYFARIIKSFKDSCRLYMCYVDNNPVSGAIAINYAGVTSYVYGASSGNYRNYMPNYLMQWNMIKWAIQTGCRIYDFQGIPYYYDKTHPNYGVYRFKKGFNGEIVNYIGEFDYIYNPVKYSLIKNTLRVLNYKKI